eukprot:m.12791 g.12791  ORF g.12791 m.12791 type:complete len:290 (+) comp6073_c0_seq1:88-957(+)
MAVPGERTVLEASEREALEAQLGLDTAGLLRHLLPTAQALSQPRVSDFRVGVAALGKSGRVYLGANLEFPGLPIASSVHAEQCMVSQAWAHGDSVVQLAVTAPPCGHCRQFLNEQAQGLAIRIMFHEVDLPLSGLLTHSFGPADLGVSETMGPDLQHFSDQEKAAWEAEVSRAHPSLTPELIGAACSALARCYTPYSRSHSAVALDTTHGIISGAYLECAAYNPSLPPIMTAVALLAARRGTPADIRSILVLEDQAAKFSHVALAESFAYTYAASAPLTVHRLSSLRHA